MAEKEMTFAQALDLLFDEVFEPNLLRGQESLWPKEEEIKTIYYRDIPGQEHIPGGYQVMPEKYKRRERALQIVVAELQNGSNCSQQNK